MSTYIAVFDETTNNQWKFFILDDPNQKEIFDTIFNESVKKGESEPLPVIKGKRLASKSNFNRAICLFLASSL